MNIFLSGLHSRPYVWVGDVPDATISTMKLNEQEMKIYMSAPHSNWMKDAIDQVVPDDEKVYVLESFFYVKDWMKPYIKNHWFFMLDSGAFTFMQNKKQSDDFSWDRYTEDYAQFIVENDVDLFFELDIDSVIGLKEVERLRKKLTKMTGKNPIPVWHKSRGRKYWEMMINEFDYVALGGIAADRNYKKQVEKVFPYFINSAKKAGAKIHGLGYTSLTKLKDYPFDSVDSTAWLYGNRSGFIYHFNGKELVKHNAPESKRMRNKETAIHNFSEWVKFQKYALTNL